MTDYRFPLDEPLIRWLNGFSSPAIDALTTWLGRPALDWTLAGLAMLWLLLTLRRRAIAPIAFALAAVAASDVIGARILKPGFHRMRPFDALPGAVHPAFAVSHLGSMPSLHAANAFALAVVVAGVAPVLAAPLYGLASLIALSRVVAGVHWPSDVLAGALFGSTIGLGAGWCLRRWESYSSDRINLPVNSRRRAP